MVMKDWWGQVKATIGQVILTFSCLKGQVHFFQHKIIQSTTVYKTHAYHHHHISQVIIKIAVKRTLQQIHTI